MNATAVRRIARRTATRTVVRAVVAASAAALLFPAAASAEDAPGTGGLTTPAPLVEPATVDSLTRTAAAETASPAAAVIKSGLISADSPADILTTYQSAVEALQKIGINPFIYPTGAPNCTSATGLPLDIAPATAGAIDGPWPNMGVIPGLNLNAVSPGETLYAFVPAGIAQDGADTSGMKLAWFNLTTFKGGFEDMGTIGDIAARSVPAGLPAGAQELATGAVTNFLKAALPFGGVRAVPVQTGNGTILAAMFGSVKNGERTCMFMPTVSINSVG